MNIKEAAKCFDDLRRRCRTLYIIYGLGMIGALALMIQQEMRSALLVFVLLLILYFVIVRSSIVQYTAKWREYCCRLFTEKLFAPVTYRYRADASRLTLFGEHLLMPESESGRLLARNLVQGSAEGVEVTVMDATLPYGEGRQTRYVSGCWMGFSTAVNVCGRLRAVKGELLPGGAYEAYLADGEGLSPGGQSVSLPGEAALYVSPEWAGLSDAGQLALRQLLERMPGDGVIEVSPDGLFVFLPHRLINRLPPSLKHPVTEAMIERITFPEIACAWHLALVLKNNEGRKAP
ncbi:MAG: hypothetical protein ACI4WX_09710 [Aristaeellaceae bacterium]